MIPFSDAMAAPRLEKAETKIEQYVLCGYLAGFENELLVQMEMPDWQCEKCLEKREVASRASGKPQEVR